MPKSKILVIEDDRAISEILVYNLDKAGYEVSLAIDGRDGVSQAQLKLPDIILLDVMLPIIDGVEVCRRLRSKPETAGSIIIMLTAKTEEADQLIGFSVGADDYVTKPFSLPELAARLKRPNDDSAGPSASKLIHAKLTGFIFTKFLDGQCSLIKFFVDAIIGLCFFGCEVTLLC
jgi:two-component system phosphate regulon response regulator PhoB